MIIIPFNDAMIIICRLFCIIFLSLWFVLLQKFEMIVLDHFCKTWQFLLWINLLQNVAQDFFLLQILHSVIPVKFSNCHSRFFCRPGSLPCMSCILHILILNNLLQTYVSLCKICKVISRGCQNGTLSENIKFVRLKTWIDGGL